MTPIDSRPSRISVAARLERLPPCRWHKTILALLISAFIFEFIDLYTFAFTAPALIQHEGFTVGDIALVTSATGVGTFLGAFGGGWVADRIGRRPTLLVLIVGYSLLSIVNSAVSTPESFVALRFLTAIGFQGMNVVGVVLLVELMPASYRGRAQAWVIACGGLGPAVLAWLAYALVPTFEWGWRVLYLIGGLGIVFVVFLARRLPESPRWQEAAGKTAQTDETMTGIEQAVLRHVSELPPPTGEMPASSGGTGGLRELFRHGYGKRFVVVCVMWILGVVGYFGFNYWVSTILKLQGFSLQTTAMFTAIITTVGVAGPAIAVAVADRWHRKYLLAAVGVVQGLLCLLFTTAGSTTAIVVFACLLSLLFQLSVPLTLTYSPEVFPTRFRSIGSGWANSSSRIANIFAPQVIAALLLGFGISAVFYFVAAVMFAFALVMGIFGERTTNVPLEKVNENRRASADQAAKVLDPSRRERT
ncbi:MFS transporter [Saccharopolyspora sp. NPDC050389]|uniref:MFS transporter n=1 Tax=Saccharopolyspora sp. NPDC050389 TaxID=3155516 RepID=UPI0034086009